MEAQRIGKKTALASYWLYLLMGRFCLMALMRLFDLMTLRGFFNCENLLVFTHFEGLNALIFLVSPYGSLNLSQKLASLPGNLQGKISYGVQT